MPYTPPQFRVQCADGKTATHESDMSECAQFDLLRDGLPRKLQSKSWWLGDPGKPIEYDLFRLPRLGRRPMLSYDSTAMKDAQVAHSS